MRTIDLRPHVRGVGLVDTSGQLGVAVEDGQRALTVALDVVDGRGCKPLEIVGLLGLPLHSVRVVRLRTRFSEQSTPSKPVPTAEAEPRPSA